MAAFEGPFYSISAQAVGKGGIFLNIPKQFDGAIIVLKDLNTGKKTKLFQKNFY